ncbi:MAG: Holliday junction resolvase RuvX [Bacilli bacterium]|nr:Holliday junction resolvase RuvX [Bacilli bacterium]
MRYLGLDFGTKTIGIAISDRTNLISSSYKLIEYKDNDYSNAVNELINIVNDNNITCIVLGLPKNMNNTLGNRAEETIKFKEFIQSKLNVEIILEDERLTTREAHKTLIEANMSRKKRKKNVDKVAASFILQNYLDRLNRKGN